METTSKASKADRRFIAFFAASVTLAMATLLNASTSTQVKQLNPLVVPRTAHAATVLTDGRILITGGRDSAGNIVAVSEIFDPATETSTAGATLTTPRVDHTATLLPNGRVLVAGGTGASGSVTSAEIFDPAIPSAGFRTLSATMGTARARHTATVLNDGTVLIAGGDAVGTAEIFDPATETFSSALLNMAATRIGHTATLFSDHSVLFAGGNTNSMELFIPADQTFTLDSQVMSAARTGHFALELSNTRLLFFDGDTGNTIDEYNSTTATITPNGALGAAASSATLLANGKILVLGANMAGLYSPDATPAFTAFDETSVPDSTALKRSGQTATELSGDKKIFVAGGKNAQNLFVGAALFNPARIWTDKDDYTPEEPVILSGSGWKAGEGVQLYAVDNATEQWTYGSTVPANVNGEFVVSPFFIVELRHAGVQFHVTALGAQSAMQADVQFTDSGQFTYATTPGKSDSVTLGLGASNATTLSVNVTAPVGNTGTHIVTLTFAPTGGPAITIGPGASQINLTSVSNSLVTKANPGGFGDMKTFPVTASVGGSVADGTYTFEAKANDNLGQIGNSGGWSFTVIVPDTTPPNPPSAPVLTSGTNSGSNADQITNDNTPNFEGTAEPNSTIKIFDGSTQVASGTTQSNGNYSVGPTSVLSEGNHTITATATDAAGNPSAPSGSTVVNIDTIRPTVTITQAAGQTDPTSTSPIHFAVNFSESVTGFAANDVTFSGAGATTAVVTGSGDTYDVAISGMTTSGTVTITIGQNAATDTAANGNTASINTDNTVQFNNNVATTLSVSAASGTYGGTVNLSATLTKTSDSSPVSGKSISFTLNGSSVGSATTNGSGVATLSGVSLCGINVAGSPYPSGVGASFAAETGFAASNGTASLTVNKATATVVVTPYSVTYNCNPHTATVTSITGVCGETGATVGTVDVSNTTHTNAGTYSSDTWSFTGTANYNDIAATTITDIIDKADATINITPYTSATTTYNCSAHTASGTASGCDGDLSSLLNLAGTTHTDAGDYPSDSWTFNNGNTNPNYNSASGTVHDSIAKANATITVTPYNVSYNCNAHTATGTATGCDGDLSSLLDLSGTTHTNAGDYPSDAWSFAGNANYNSDSGTVHDVIQKANTTSSVTSNVNPSTIGQPVTFTATVAGNPAVTCMPTGTVTFKDGATVLGTGTLNGSAQATFSTSSLSAGNHSITAVYSGDGNFNATGATAGSTAPIYVQSVHYIFVGFLPPVDNLPVWNSAKGGQTIPIKWQLKDFNGNIICDLSTLATPNGLTSIQITCPGGAAVVDVIEEVLASPGSTVFRCDGTQFIYNWQTSKSWAGTCRLMTVRLADGTTHTAQFSFK